MLNIPYLVGFLLLLFFCFQEKEDENTISAEMCLLW